MSDATNRATAGKPEGAIPNSEDVCIYIAEICGELRTLAQGPRFRTINYLLDMARLEAERMAKDMRSHNGLKRIGNGR